MVNIGRSKGTEPFLRHKGDVNDIARSKADRPRELDKNKRECRESLLPIDNVHFTFNGISDIRIEVIPGIFTHDILFNWLKL